VSLLAWSLESQPVERSEKPRVWPTRFATPDQLNPRAPGAPPSPPRQLIAIQPNTPRVPASNAKLFATVAAAKLLRDTYRFVTEISVAKNGGPLYVWGTGDPLFDRADLAKLAQQVSAKGLNSVRGIVIDDSHFGARRLAPGFEQFDESAYYRPPSGALNLDSNILHIRVSADRRRKTPRVQVFPASEYVKVRKRIRFAAARSGSAARRRSVRIRSEEASAHMWLVVEGTFGVRARHFSTRRPVLDPSLNFGWALRRALKEHGIEVLGPVWRGRKPPGSRVIAELERPLDAVLAATNTNSDNLAAEALVRAIGHRAAESASQARGSWKAGLKLMHEHLRKEYGISGLQLLNGSGLHRNSKVTASALCALLSAVQGREPLRRQMLPTMALAGRRGTLVRRLRGGITRGRVYGKTGTLSGVLALSGLITPEGPHPVVFSLLVNGSSNPRIRRQIDRVVTLLARFAQNRLPGDAATEQRRLATPSPTNELSESRHNPPEG
jgi:D-alanyl-D-alanine carboxypeptidase/D-alanyl-D-alanine-endopeptidase (penicillin-binding protein 4)